MKRKYYYFKVSYMSKVQKGALIRSGATASGDTKLFPLMSAIEHSANYLKNIAIPESIMIDSPIEISKEDYEAYNKLYASQREVS